MPKCIVAVCLSLVSTAVWAQHEMPPAAPQHAGHAMGAPPGGRRGSGGPEALPVRHVAHDGHGAPACGDGDGAAALEHNGHGRRGGGLEPSGRRLGGRRGRGSRLEHGDGAGGTNPWPRSAR